MSLADMYGSGRTQTVVPNQTAPPRADNPAPLPLSGTYPIAKARADIRNAAQEIAKKEGERDKTLKDLADAEGRRDSAQKELGNNDLAQILLEKVSDYSRQQVKQRIEEVVSQFLNVIYGGNHSFIIKLDVKSNQPTAEYWLNDGYTMVKLERPDFVSGGGKAEVIGLAIALTVMELMGVPGPIFLDEVGKQVDTEAVVNLAYFIKEYAQDFDRQIILITHNETLAATGDLSYKVTKRNGTAEVVKI
jgi:DNA repair exonuclease SbcCD ATPase subunit